MMSPVRFLDRRSPPHVLTLVVLAGMSTLAMNIFLPSLPGMAAYFGVPYGVMQQSVALYLALSAGLQIIIGPMEIPGGDYALNGIDPQGALFSLVGARV